MFLLLNLASWQFCAMRLISHILVAIMVFSAVPAHAEIVLYCVEEYSMGLIKENGNWKQTTFKEGRFTIKFSDNHSSMVHREGSFTNRYVCEKSKVAPILCVERKYGVGETFSYDKRTQHFTRARSTILGYLGDGFESTRFGAGKCDKF